MYFLIQEMIDREKEIYNQYKALHLLNDQILKEFAINIDET